MKSRFFTAVIGAFVALSAIAEQKPLSPPASAEVRFGGKKVAITYSAPSKRDRVIIGGLVPFGKVWRTGANAATTLTTEAELTFGKIKLPRGTYTLFTLPDKKAWVLIVNKETGQWGTQYDASKDFGRTSMTVKPVKDTVEMFKINLDKKDEKSGVLRLVWENTEVSVPFNVR